MYRSNSSSVRYPSSRLASRKRQSLVVRRLGQLRGLVVADVLIERGHQHQALLHVLVNALEIGLHALNAELDKHVEVSVNSRTECMKL